MKKFFIAVIFSLLLIAMCRAESWVKYIDAQLDGNKVNEANADLSQIEVEFCDKPGEKSIVYTVAPGWIQDVCLKATNVSNKDIEATIEFVDGTVTNDQRKNKACMQQGENKNFWQYVTGFTASFTIPANNLMYQHASIQLPKSATWLVNWCLVFYTKSVEMWGQMNFSVLMRKAKFIDIQVRENVFIKKYLFYALSIMVLIYYAKVFIFPKKKRRNIQK